MGERASDGNTIGRRAARWSSASTRVAGRHADPASTSRCKSNDVRADTFVDDALQEGFPWCAATARV